MGEENGRRLCVWLDTTTETTLRSPPWNHEDGAQGVA
jgi:hypothetical protein